MICEMQIRNYSERTIRNYVSSLSGLARYFNQSPCLLNQSQVKEYAYYLIHQCNCSVSSINLLISAWKLLQVDVLNHPWEEFIIKRPRREKKLPRVLAQSEILQMITSTRNIKHRAIMQLAYTCGLRRNELLQIRFEDINASRMVLRVVFGKGKKMRELPLNEDTLALLRQYYRQYRPKTFLFEGVKRGQRYSATSFGKIVKRAALKCGISWSPSPHVLRHSFATHMLENGINLKRLQLLLGHYAMKTTSIYLHLARPKKDEVPNLMNLAHHE